MSSWGTYPSFILFCVPSTSCFANSMCSINTYSIHENFPDSLPASLFPTPTVVFSYFPCDKSFFSYRFLILFVLLNYEML